MMGAVSARGGLFYFVLPKPYSIYTLPTFLSV